MNLSIISRRRGVRHRAIDGRARRRASIASGPAPSASLGTDGMDKYRSRFHIHRLTFAVGDVRLNATEQVSVS